MLRTGSLHPGTTLFYPSLVIYTDAAVLAAWAVMGQAAGRYQGREDFVAREWPALPYRLCRMVTAVFGVLTVVTTFALASAMFGSASAGLLAALAVATNYLHVRDSHFATVDVPMTFFTTACLLFAVRAAQDGRVATYAAAGLFAGLAASAKYNGAAVILAPFAAALLPASREDPGGRARTLARRLTAAAGAAGLAYALTSPYTLLLWRATLRELSLTRSLLYETVGERAVLTHLRTTFPVGFGWPVCLAALVGVGRAVGRRHPAGLVVLAYSVPLLASVLSVRAVYPRYLVPLVPVLAVFAADAAAALGGRSRRLVAAVAILFAAPGLAHSVQFGRLAAREDTRLLASAWGNLRLPRNARVMVCRGYGMPEFDRRTKPIDCRGEQAPFEWGRYLVTASHPVLGFDGISPRLEATVRARGRLLATFDPFRHGAGDERPYFYGHDAFYLPFAGLEAVERGGPVLAVWDLRPSS